MTLIDTKYFREYREKLGFSNQNDIKTFLAAKDIIPSIDYSYIELLNGRLFDVISKIDSLLVVDIRIGDLSKFHEEKIAQIFSKLKINDIIPRLNNQGRRPEEVYFSWMRGFLISSYFLKALALIFEVNIGNIDLIGDDDFANIETFKRTPKADLQIKLKTGEIIRIEVQSGFQGVNDIKQHKVLEAKRIKREENISSLVVHFDLFNGQVAFVKTDEIDDESVDWVTRQQMEGQTVFTIDQNYFMWKLTEFPPKFADLLFT